MIKKIPVLLAFLVLVIFPVFSQELSNHYFDSFTYYNTALQKEEHEYLSSPQNLKDKLNLVQKAYEILLDFLYTAEDKDFYHQLRLSKSYIEYMTKIDESIFSEIHPDRYCDRRPYNFNGISTYIYYNTFSRHSPLSDEERTLLYNEELNRHKHIQLLPIQPLNKNALKKLSSSQTYNFVLTLQNKSYISYDQSYRLRSVDSKSLLISPNHTMLAGHVPLLSVGVFKYYKVGKKELFIISCSSGHFHPMPDCLVHMKNYLMSLGVPEEAIISLPVSMDKIHSQIAKQPLL